MAHVKLFHFVEDNVDIKLVWINLFKLFFVVLLPFSTAFYVNGITQPGPFLYYCLNIALHGIFHYILIKKVFKLRSLKSVEDLIWSQWHKWGAIQPEAIWLSAGLIGFVSPAGTVEIYLCPDLCFQFLYRSLLPQKA